MKIEKNIPIPKKQTNKSRPRKLPFYEMEIGDSVLMENRQRSSFAAVLARLKYSEGKEFTTRMDSYGVRVWRIK